MLVASVLAVVAGQPVSAANTASEMLVDTDDEFYLRVYDDGVLEGRQYQPDKTREFAGTHRYNTSVALSERFAREAGTVATVIVASGESEIDAVAASGLAGYLNAPILLTRSDRLPHNAARFIDRHNVTNVIVAGGPDAVSDAVLTALEGLGSGPEVRRVMGDDRYETATAMAGELGGPAPTWCNSDQRAAILVHGGDNGRSDAVVIGPLAYALGVPVLLTTSDGLSDATAKYLADTNVEHVVIVGGTTAVPDAIIDELIEDVGVVTTRRISGADAADTSVKVAEEMLDANRCGTVLDTDTTLVALVNRDAVADGITAGPVMGQGFSDDGPVPILLVGSSLPATVRDYLAATPTGRSFGSARTHLELVAIGGSAVVSAEVMAAAVDAANTAPKMITAEIHGAGNVDHDSDPATPAVGRFRVTFSDDVKLPGSTATAGAISPTLTNASSIDYDNDLAVLGGTVLEPTLYRVNGTPVTLALSTQSSAANDDGAVANEISVRDRTVTITLSRPFAVGATAIDVVGGSKVGAHGDMRLLASATSTVNIAAPAVDRAGPVVEILAVSGRGSFDVIVTDASTLLAQTAATPPYGHVNLFNAITIDPAGSVGPQTVTTVAAATTYGRPGAASGGTGIRLTVTVPELAPGGTSRTTLDKNDEIRVKANSFRDARDQGNRLAVERVKDAVSDLRITSVSIGDPTPVTGSAAAATLTSGGTDMVITAKQTPGAVARGAKGNGWRLYGYEHASFAGATRVDIDVYVDTRYQRIVYTMRAGTRFARQLTLFDLASTLRTHDDFDANFTVGYVSGQSNKYAALAATNTTGIAFTGGRSQVTVRVNFNDVIETLNAEVLRDAINNGATGFADPTTLFAAPDRMVHYTYATATDGSGNEAQLPQPGGVRVIQANAADNYHDVTVDQCGPRGTAPPCATGVTPNTDASDDSAALILRQLRRGL